MINAAFQIYKTNPISLVLLLLRGQRSVLMLSPDMGFYRPNNFEIKNLSSNNSYCLELIKPK
jgi:hypothetical protein